MLLFTHVANQLWHYLSTKWLFHHNLFWTCKLKKKRRNISWYVNTPEIFHLSRNSDSFLDKFSSDSLIKLIGSSIRTRRQWCRVNTVYLTFMLRLSSKKEPQAAWPFRFVVRYSKTCLTWTLAYTDTPPTVDKILCMDRLLSIYPLICGQTCHAWMVDTKKSTTEQNYLLLCGHLVAPSEDAMAVLMN